MGAAGKGNLPDKPAGKPEASAQARCPGRDATPGSGASLPEGQVGVVPLPASEGVALPPPQVGFHTYPELVWHPTAGPLHPPGSQAWRSEHGASSRQSTFLHPPACDLQLPLTSVWQGRRGRLAGLHAPHQENGSSNLVPEDWVPVFHKREPLLTSAIQEWDSYFPRSLFLAHRGCGFGSHSLCQIQSKA